ncbi:MAG: hypothetical protein Q7K42_01210 [Candidatus Diapherotrites archaeon]|nr:hypothetical protein [Candidatus Diapherotrites archaeon]
MSTEMNLEMYIAPGVEYESVTRPREINRFKLSSVRIGDAIKEGWMKVWKDKKQIQESVKEIQEIANKIYYSDEGEMTIMHLGEAESLALINIMQTDIFGIDERTVRMLIEEPFALKKHMQIKYEQNIYLNKEMLEKFKALMPKITIIRSTELISLAFENGLFQQELSEDQESLSAALYSLKYSGCAISGQEIEEFVNKKLKGNL